MSKKVYFVTGGCGFIGSHIVDYLIDNHDDILIINFDKLGIGSNINNIQRNDRVITYVLDISNENIFKYFKEYKPDYIIHCAAESHVDRSINNPLVFVNSNVNGTANILEGMRQFVPNARMVHVSTDEVYGHLAIDDPPFTELSNLHPRSPYSASKAGSDMLALAYANTYNLDISITRCCNNYGPRQYREKLIPTIINSIKRGEKIPVYGNGENIREWIYVMDHVKAIVEVLYKQEPRQVYNIYGTQTLSNIEIIKTIINMIEEMYPVYKRNSFDDYITFVQDRLGHDFKYAMSSLYTDIECLNSQKDFKEGLKETISSFI